MMRHVIVTARCPDRAPLPATAPRRGVLLLIVLSMLTLFMMLGATFLVAASRARLAARAYSRLTFMGDDARIPHDRAADAVLATVLRGGVTITGTGIAVDFEAILADQYGPAAPITGNATVLSGSSPVLVVNATLAGTVRPLDLNGRVLSFVAPGRRITSHRIIRARNAAAPNSNTPGTVFNIAIGTVMPTAPFIPPSGPVAILINGRDFDGTPATLPATSNEPWDGFDSDNPFLAHVALGTGISTTTVPRVSYARPTSGPPFSSSDLTTALSSGTASPYDFDIDGICDITDNDGDGVPDGVFLDFRIPDTTDAAGNKVRTRASVLVMDLGGRFNVNAHDSLPRLIYSGTANWTTAVNAGSVPLGSGYGVAEVNGGKLFIAVAPTASLVTTGSFPQTENPPLLGMIGGPAARINGSRDAVNGSRYAADQDTPRLTPIEGRYGERGASNWANVEDQTLKSATPARFSRPGQPDTDDRSSQIVDRRLADPGISPTANYGIPPIWWTGTYSTPFDWSGSIASFPPPRGIFNSPPDIHGRMKTFTLSATAAGALAPRLAFVQPEWSDSTATGSHRESRDDPYEFLLNDRRGGGGLLFESSAGGTGTTFASLARDNPFTPAELEPVLRPYDVDTNRHSPRLAAMLGSAAEESRLKVTTDSWDTTAITGSAARRLFGPSSGSTGWFQRAASPAVYDDFPTLSLASGEVSRGERFDLNRAFAASDSTNHGYPSSEASLRASAYHHQRVNYFKDLYTLLVGLHQSGTGPLPANESRALAQWAANVVEFRDADSRIIPFEYDADPLRGWAVDGFVSGTTLPSGGPESRRQVVWGAERPELLLQEVFAWKNTATGTSGFAVTIHRPWNATAYASGSSSFIAGEPCDAAFDTLSSGTSGRPTNVLDLGKNSSATAALIPNPSYVEVSGTTYPIWRLRLDVPSGTKYIRLDTGTTSAANEYVVDTGSPTITPADKPKLPVDSSVTLHTGSTITLGDPAEMPGTATLMLTGSATKVKGPPSLESGTIFLERLSDPTVAVTTGTSNIPGYTISGSAVWSGTTSSGTTSIPLRYIAVDQCPFVPVETQTVPSTAESRTRRTTGAAAFWAHPSNAPESLGNLSNGTSVTFPTALGAGQTAWFHWPNRPFVSAAELLLVPQGDATAILRDYTKLGPSLSGTIAPVISGSVGGGRGVPVALDLLFEAVHVPSRFAGLHTTGTSAIVTGTSTGIDATITTINQLSTFREPGRVNLNTVVADDIWNAVVAGPLSSAVRTGTLARYAIPSTVTPNPGRSLYALLTLHSGTSGSVVISDTASASAGLAPPLTYALNPQQELYTATRLANTVTPRSNVFAIWVSTRESVDGDPDSVRIHRAFYIVDRSIPVAFEEGKDHNTWDCVRLRRIIE